MYTTLKASWEAEGEEHGFEGSSKSDPNGSDVAGFGNGDEYGLLDVVFWGGYMSGSVCWSEDMLIGFGCRCEGWACEDGLWELKGRSYRLAFVEMCGVFLRSLELGRAAMS